MRPVNEIIIHCTATHPDWWSGKKTSEKVAEVKRWHVDQREWSDIGYHFLIDRDGTVAKGRPLSRMGAHVKGKNKGTIGISLFGGAGSSATDDFGDNFTAEQDAALRELIADLQAKHPNLTRISGHNEYAAKACPGFAVSEWQSQPFAQSVFTRTLPKQDPVPEEIPQEVEELIQETERGGLSSKTNIFSTILGLVGVGGPLAGYLEAVPSTWLLGGVGLIAIVTALYFISSRLRKTAKGKAARSALAMDHLDGLQNLLADENIRDALIAVLRK